MKIVFTIAHMNLGGAQRVCYNLINWILNNTDSKVHLIVCSCKKQEERFDLSKISHSFVSGGSFSKILGIRKELKKFEPDILITMGVPQALFDVPACTGLGIKHVISERNDPAHFGGKAIVRVISRFLMRFADGYIFQTREARDYYGGRIAKNSTIIPNPLFNTDKMPLKRYEGGNTKTIVSVGRLHRQKNHHLLINAFKKIVDIHPEYRLVIYGEGPERANDENLIESQELNERVFLPGVVSNIFNRIHDASLFVLPSDFEGMPNALMEAMALGLPCISTDCPCGGPRELIENGKNGILVPVGDENTLVKSMNQLICDEDMRKKIGQNAMRIRETHNIDTVCRDWNEYFLRIK